MREEHWRAIVSCDAAYDGQFVYGVTTTGVFCRPSCRSKTPDRRHVRILASPAEARRAGFRPCKRCRPELGAGASAREELVAEALRLISSHFAEELTLREMASRLFVSPFHLQRVFKQALHVSPAQFLTKTRIEAAQAMLAHSDLSVTAIALNVGFKNPAHFSAVFRRETGRRPTEYRAISEGTRAGTSPSA